MPNYFDLPGKLPANKEAAALIRGQQRRVLEAEQQRLQAACLQHEVVCKQFEQVSQELTMIQKQHYVAPLTTVDQVQLRESFMQSLDGVLEELVSLQAVALAAAADLRKTNIEQRLKDISRQAIEYMPNNARVEEPPFDEAEIERELLVAAQHSVSQVNIEATRQVVHEAIERWEYEHGPRLAIYSPEEQAAATKIQAVRRGSKVRTASVSHARLLPVPEIEALGLESVQVHWAADEHTSRSPSSSDSAVFRVTKSYTFGDVAEDARRYWRIKNPLNPNEEIRCWDMANIKVYHPEAFVNNTLSALPANERALQIRLSAVPAAIQEEEEEFPENKKEYVTTHDRAELIRYILTNRLRRRWQRKLGLRAVCHYIFTILFAAMMCFDPTRGYLTVRAPRPEPRACKRLCFADDDERHCLSRAHAAHARALCPFAPHSTPACNHKLIVPIAPGRQANAMRSPLKSGMFNYLQASTEQRYEAFRIYTQNNLSNRTAYYTELSAFDPDNRVAYAAFWGLHCERVARVGSDYVDPVAADVLSAGEYLYGELTSGTAMGLLNTLWPFDRNGTFTQHEFDDFRVPEEFERRFPLPGRWSELGDGFTAFPFIGALGTWHHYSMEGFPNLFTLGKVKTLGGIKAFIQFYLMEVLAPRCNYGGKAIE